MTDRQRLTWQQTFFKGVISLSSLRWFFSLLNEQWWRQRFPDCLIVEFSVKQVQVHRDFLVGGIREDDFGSLRIVEVVKELGLVTCQRGEFRQGSSLLSWRPWFSCLGIVHIEEKVQDRVQIEAEEKSKGAGRDTRKGTRRGTELRPNAQLLIMDDHADDMSAHNSDMFLSQCGAKHIMMYTHCAEETWRVRCISPNTPSVTVDRRRL